MSKYLSLPEGVTEENFTKAVNEFKKILGDENVFISSEDLTPYTKVLVPIKKKNHMPSAVLVPHTVEEIQAIMGVCNKYLVPIWTFSTGKNFGYGSAMPAKAGTALMDLRRMNKIIEVNKELGYALVEPGVTYQMLHDYIQEHKLGLWLSCPAPSAIVGPVGNTMDRGVGYTPYGEHFLFQCGMELVLADGQVLRTGMGGLKDSNSWQVFKWGFGPTLDGIFTQSNYGVCTKMGFWLMPEPPAYKPFCISFPDDTDIVEIVDTLRPLRIANIIPNAFTIANTSYEAASVVNRSDYHKGDGHITAAELKQLQKDKKMGAWNVYAALYGDPVSIEHNWNIVKSVFADNKKAKFYTEDELGDDPIFKYRAKLMRGDPTLQEFSLYNWKGGGGSMWFAPVSPAEGKHTLVQQELATKIMNKYGFDYVGEFIVGWRDMHHIVDLLFNKNDPAEMQRAKECYTELVQEFAKLGYGVYRTHVGAMEEVGDTYGPVIKDVFHKLKKALDPNNILAPGKSGIDLSTYDPDPK